MDGKKKKSARTKIFRSGEGERDEEDTGGGRKDRYKILELSRERSLFTDDLDGNED